MPSLVMSSRLQGARASCGTRAVALSRSTAEASDAVPVSDCFFPLLAVLTVYVSLFALLALAIP